MLSAFTAEPIVELKARDKSKIESILAHGDQLLVGLNTGILRVYRVLESTPQHGDVLAEHEASHSTRSTTELLKEQEKFSKYKIEQLAVLKEVDTLVSLSGGAVSLHDLTTFELQQTLAKTKGATTFAVTSNIVNDATTSIPGLVSSLAVAVKRRLLLWSWQDGELIDEAREIPLANSIKSLAWASGARIVAGLQNNYVLVDIQTKDVKTIHGPGSIGGGSEHETGRLGGIGSGTMSYMGMGAMIPTPLITGLSRDEMLLARDINSLFVDRIGEPLSRRQIPWRVAPLAVGYSYPFLLSLHETSKGLLEVRNPVTLTVLQSIELPGATLMQVPNPNISLAHQGKGFLVANERMVWRMKALAYDAQIDALVRSNAFDEAIDLLALLEETLVTDKVGRNREIKMLKAQRYFDEKKFRDSLELFGEAVAPPERVIRLFPELISGDLANKSATPTQIKSHRKTTSITSTRMSKNDDAASMRSVKQQGQDLPEKELKAAVRELQLFLADVRRRLQRFFNDDQSVKDLSDVQQTAQFEDLQQTLQSLLGVQDLTSSDVSERLREVACLVDTTLFRAHMYATPSLAGSLFRIANFCDPDVVINRLEDSERYGDLIDFLYGKKLHRRALELLQKFGTSQKTEEIDQSLHGPGRTVTYLQYLGPELSDLILEFAQWPVETNPELAMTIFTADTENAEQLPRDKVLNFLKGIDKTLAVQYLEHIIEEWDDDTSEMHQQLLSLYLESLRSNRDELRADMLAKFLTLLRISNQFSPAKLLSMLPKDDPDFFEANAIVLSKMGQHKQALQIYVFKLNDTVRAEEYCNQVYLDEQTKNEISSISKHKLPVLDTSEERPTTYHMLLNLYLNPPTGQRPLVGPAIELMARHGPRLPASSTLEMIPNDLLVGELEFYFRGRIRNANTVMNDARVVSNLQKVSTLRLQTALLLGQDTITVQSNGGRQRKVRIDEDRVCGVCYKRLGGSVISVFPDNSVVHLGCANRRQSEITSQA